MESVMKKRSLTLLAFVIVTAVSWASYGNGQASGTSLFGSKCAACHGKDGAGLSNWKSKGQPDLTKSEWQDSHTDAEIADTIKNGKGKFMPSFKDKLSDEEINAVVSRVRMLVKGSSAFP